MSFAPGTRVGPYEVVSSLGSGGMGEVFRARDTRLDREVAIKVLRRDQASDGDRLRRFIAEAKTVSSLNHPNILTLHEIGEHEGVPYIVTELVTGRTLRQLLAEGPLPAERALDIAIQAAEGLARAHEAGIVHRDVKPENLMLTPDGLVKILDFGLAKLAAPEASQATVDETATAVGLIVGTPAYLSPEQLQGLPADPRSDVFALGVVLYEMITGKNPFRRNNAAATLSAILRDTPPLAHEHQPTSPPGVSPVLVRAMAKEQKDRYPDARELAARLREVRTAAQLAKAAPGLTTQVRQRSFGPLVVAGIAVVALVAWWGLTRPGERSSTAQQIAAATASPAMAVPAVPIAPPEGKTGVAVLPIRNESGAPELANVGIDRILRDVFVQILTEAPRLYVIHPQRLEGIARNLGRSLADANDDGAFAHTLATEAHAGALLTGTLSKVGKAFVLTATLTQVSNDVIIETFRAQAQTPESLLEELSGQMLDQMPAESTGVGSNQWHSRRDVMPGRSVDAYAYYLKGEDMAVEGDWDAAVPDLLKAVELDPEMALAWSSLACAYSFAGDDVKARAASLKAQEFVGHLNERERRWVELDKIWVMTQDADAFLQSLDTFIKDFPDERDSYFYGGLALDWLKNDPRGALPWYEKAYELLPNYYPVTRALADCYGRIGQRDRAISALQRYLAQPYVGPRARAKAEAKLREIQGAA